MEIKFMKRLTTICLIAFVLSSCGKTNKDFVGEYQTLYPAKIDLPDNFNPLMSFSHSSQKRETTAKSYCELADIKINLFIDESEKILKGEAEVIFKDVEKFSFLPTVKTKEMDFDIVNIRINNDTLEFSLENQLLKLEGKKIKGRLVKTKDGDYLGFDKDLTGKNLYTEKSPLFRALKDEIIFYKTITIDQKREEVMKQFYRAQIIDLTKSAQEAENSTQKKIAENSIKELESKLSK